jgi:uncharacterized membrane protein YfcA
LWLGLLAGDKIACPTRTAPLILKKLNSPFSEYALLLVSAFLAGAINSMAGGGSFFTFPALVFTGVPPVAANASSTVALVPGSFASAYAYRHDFSALKSFGFRNWLLVSLAGGLTGAILLIVTPNATFTHIIPWLLLLATLSFAFGNAINGWLRQRVQISAPALLVVLFAVSTYGGYFGGGAGMMILAMFSLYGLTDIHAMNGAKALLGGSMNAMAVAVFVVAHQVYWRQSLVMMVASIAGGLAGATLAKRIPPEAIRVGVIVVGAAMTVYFFRQSILTMR